MILKEKTYKKSRNPNEVRGDETESQMSFYLRRYFGDSSNIFVLNDVYLSVDNESAQIDHLVGLLVVSCGKSPDNPPLRSPQ